MYTTVESLNFEEMCCNNMKNSQTKPEPFREFLDLYRSMVTARTIDALEEEFVQRGEAFFQVSGTGHEGTAALCPHLIARDWLHCHYRDKALMVARGVLPDMFFHSLFCTARSHSGGRQMSAHISAPELNIMSIIGPVGNSALQAVGVASVIHNDPDSPLVLCSLGDGTSQQGEVLEAIAHAVREQLPVLFLIHNNRYAISTLTATNTFFSRPDGHPETFYGMPITWIDGRHAIEAYHAFAPIVARLRNDRQPALVIFDVDRLTNHTNADDQSVYRSREEIEQARTSSDPIRILREDLEKQGVSRQQLDRIDDDLQAIVEAAAQMAQAEPEPRPAFTAKKEIPPQLQDPRREYRGNQHEPRLTMLEALRAVLEDQMRQDSRITLFGEDVEDPKGDVFGLTRGLTRKFPGRVKNSPLSESTILGVSIGRALAGARPVAFIQFADFLPLAYNQIFAELGSLYWRSNGGWEAPVIVMISCGAYRPGLGPFHSGSLEALAVHTPGIDVFMPSTASDAAGLLNAAFASGRPTLFFYPKNCLNNRNTITSPDISQQFVPIGNARIVRQGDDMTLLGWGNTVAVCQDVAQTLEHEGIWAEVIDLRSLSPWDTATVLASAEKTGRLIVVHEDNQSCGLGAEILATVMEHAQTPVKVKRVTRPDTYIPCHFQNQLEVLPSFKRVLEAAGELLNLDITWRSPEKEQEDHTFIVQAIGSSPSDESVEIIELHVTPGTRVSPGDLLATVEADKAIQELHSPIAGDVVKILVPEGRVVTVGTPLMKIRTDVPVPCKMPTREQPGQPVFTRKEAPVLLNNYTSFQQHVFAVGLSTIGVALGSRIVTNDDLAGMIPAMTAHDILKRTGIEQRHWINDHETALTLGIDAARAALEHEHLELCEFDLLLCCSGTPLFMTPSMACLILNALSHNHHDVHVRAYDMNAACTGYLYALQATYDYLQHHPTGKALIVTTETLSCKLNRHDPATAPLFGDAATASIVYGEAYLRQMNARVVCLALSAQGDNGDMLSVPLHNGTCITMDGHKVFPVAVRKMIMMLKRACHQAGIGVDALDLIVPHQANQRIIDAVRRRTNVPEEKVFSNIRHLGNTSSSSIPLCLGEVFQQRRSGERVGLCAFGGSLTFGGAVLQIL